MRSRWLIIFCVLIGLLAACDGEESNPPANNPTSQANSNAPRLKVIVSEARAFTYPSRDADIAFRLIEGDILPILARTEPDAIGVSWYQVGQGDQFGWVAGSQVEIQGETTALRVVSLIEGSATPLALSPTPLVEITATTAPLDDPMIRVNVPVAVVLTTPSREGAEATRLLQGETADILGKTETPQGDVFYLIGREQVVLGWILETQVLAEGNLPSVPVVNLDEALAAVLPTEITVAGVAAPTLTLSATETPPVVETSIALSVTATTIPLITATPTPDLAGTSQAAPTATEIVSAVITESVTPQITAESGTPTITPIPEIEAGVPPPFTMTLPEDWGEAHFLVPIRSSYLQGTLPVSLYQGNFSDGTFGFIWVVWGFPNVTTPGTEDLNLYADGLQILRGIVFDSTNCILSLGNERREYTVGGLDAVGTIYSVTDCPDTNDTAGFFAALEAEGGNYAFIMGVEPVDSTATGLPQLQTILDSVQFEPMVTDTE